MMPEPNDFPPGQGPGDIDMVLGTVIQNPFNNKVIKLISSTDEFEELRGRVLQPGERIQVNLFIPAGYREFIKPTKFNGQEYLYIGLRDKDQAEPIIHKPKV